MLWPSTAINTNCAEEWHKWLWCMWLIQLDRVLDLMIPYKYFRKMSASVIFPTHFLFLFFFSLLPYILSSFSFYVSFFHRSRCCLTEIAVMCVVEKDRGSGSRWHFQGFFEKHFCFASQKVNTHHKSFRVFLISFCLTKKKGGHPRLLSSRRPFTFQWIEAPQLSQHATEC